MYYVCCQLVLLDDCVTLVTTLSSINLQSFLKTDIFLKEMYLLFLPVCLKSGTEREIRTEEERGERREGKRREKKGKERAKRETFLFTVSFPEALQLKPTGMKAASGPT